MQIHPMTVATTFEQFEQCRLDMRWDTLELMFPELYEWNSHVRSDYPDALITVYPGDVVTICSERLYHVTWIGGEKMIDEFRPNLAKALYQELMIGLKAVS